MYTQDQMKLKEEDEIGEDAFVTTLIIVFQYKDFCLLEFYLRI